MAKNFYRGFSTISFEEKKTFSLVDVDLIKRDLLNHIFTRKGERIMFVDFGTYIPDIVFEPLDIETVELVKSEIQKVIDYDPRVQLLDMNTEIVDYSIKISMTLYYLELAFSDKLEFHLDFQAQ